MARRDLPTKIALEDSSPRRMKRLMIRFFALLCAATGGLVGYSGMQQVRQSQDTQSWPSVTGKVYHSSVRTQVRQNQDEKALPRYIADVRYEFTVGKVIVHGSRIAPGENAMSSASQAQKTVDRYPEGKVVTVYYQPHNYQLSVLEPGVTTNAWILTAAGAGILGLAAVIGFWLPRYLNLLPT